jgi:hypothetical protein
MSPHRKLMLNMRNRCLVIGTVVTLLLITVATVMAVGPSDTTVADFAAGSGCYVEQTLTGTDGEVVLTPAFGDMFDGAFPGTWGAEPFQFGGTAIVSSGVLTPDNAVAYSPLYAQPRSVEFLATFSITGSQHAGFLNVISGTNVVSGNLNTPWAFFSTGNLSLNQGFYARTNDGTTAQDSLISIGNWLGVPHRYRIDWTATNVIYSIDGTPYVTHTTNLPAADMRVGFSDNSSDVLIADWVRISDYAATCTFTSRQFDSGVQDAQWLTLNSIGVQQPGVATYSFETCASNTTGSCTTWNPVSGSSIYTPTFGQYIRYRAMLTTTDQLLTPIIETVDLSGQTPTAVTMEAFGIQSGRSDWTTPLLVALLVAGVSVPVVAGFRLRSRR